MTSTPGCAPQAIPQIGILYNQVPTTFGKPTSADPLRPGGGISVEFPALHFWPDRWRQYTENRLRIVVGAGESPTLRAIFNQSSVSEENAQVLLTRTAALLEAITDDTPFSTVPKFVESALASRRCS